MLIGLAVFSGLSMCASDPPPPAPEPEIPFQAGPDGLEIRSAPTEAIEAGVLPLPAPAAPPAEPAAAEPATATPAAEGSEP
jgi:hypothetical protein